MKKFLKYMIICIVLLFMYIPILVLAVYSFTDAANIGAIHAFSMHNYVTLFTTPELINMIIGSACCWKCCTCNNTWNNRCYRCILFKGKSKRSNVSS